METDERGENEVMKKYGEVRAKIWTLFAPIIDGSRHYAYKKIWIYWFSFLILFWLERMNKNKRRGTNKQITSASIFVHSFEPRED